MNYLYEGHWVRRVYRHDILIEVSDSSIFMQILCIKLANIKKLPQASATTPSKNQILFNVEISLPHQFLYETF